MTDKAELIPRMTLTKAAPLFARGAPASIYVAGWNDCRKIANSSTKHQAGRIAELEDEVTALATMNKEIDSALAVLEAQLELAAEALKSISKHQKKSSGGKYQFSTVVFISDTALNKIQELSK